MKTEITSVAHDKEEYNYETKCLKNYGYKRTENAFWVEHWDNGKNIVIIVKDF